MHHCCSHYILMIHISQRTLTQEIMLFADDCVCYREIKDTEDTLSTLFGKEMWHEIPTSQIKLSYILEGTVLGNVENIKYLGISITNDLRWNTHFSNICTKSNMTYGFLRRI